MQPIYTGKKGDFQPSPGFKAIEYECPTCGPGIMISVPRDSAPPDKVKCPICKGWIGPRKKKWSLARRVRPGEMAPRFYGLAYIDWMKDDYVCYPVPLNFLVSIGRRIWARAKHGIPGIDEERTAIYQRGWAHGYRVGRVDERKGEPWQARPS